MLFKLLFPLILLSASQGLYSREVETVEDEIRIQGFAQNQNEKRALEKDRLAGLQAHKKINEELASLRDKDLERYRKEKQLQSKKVDDSGRDYKEYLEEKLAEEKERSRIEEWYAHQKVLKRAKNKKQVLLSEEEELGIYDHSEKVDWDKRKFFGKVAGSSRPSFGGSGDFGSPQPSPGFFESEPPPPPPVMYDPVFENEVPPPPPPMFDEDSGF